MPNISSTVANAPEYRWYGVIEGDDLEQGDILEACPVFFPPEHIPEDAEKSTFTYGKLDLIVISQSCDLAKEREKIKQVSLCALTRQSEFKANNRVVESSRLEDIRTGKMPRYHMIASSAIPGFECEIRIVDLQQVYSLPISFVRHRASSERHLRLLPPYREHLAQAFARVYMRVGLPIDIPSFTSKSAR